MSRPVTNYLIRNSKLLQTLDSSQQELKVPELVTEQQQVKGLLRAFLALRHRNFRLFWSGQLISLIGTWMQTTGQAWLVLELTHSAWLLGVVSALQFLPVLLLSLFGGVLADRVPKRKVLLFTQSFAALQAFVLWTLVATGEVQLWHVLILASLLGLTNSVDALSFLPVILGLALIDLSQLYAQAKRIVGQNDTPKQSTLQSLREGLVYVAHTPSILLIICIVGAVALFGMNFNVLMPLFATDVLHVGAAGFGFISSAIGLGALFSALWLAWSNTRPSIHRLLLSTIVFCVLEIFFAISHWYLLSLVLIAGAGFASIAFSATANTIAQTVAPDYLRGRVMSVYMMVFVGSAPFGSLFIGGLAHLFGAPVALFTGAGIGLIAAVIGWLLRAPAEKSLAETTRTIA